ncbi:sunset domain-containing protein [Lactobacillus laiwuensis]
MISNQNSKVFHLSLQTSYRQNVANAVYFKSEQDAIKARFCKSLL